MYAFISCMRRETIAALFYSVYVRTTTKEVHFTQQRVVLDLFFNRCTNHPPVLSLHRLRHDGQTKMTILTLSSSY